MATKSEEYDGDFFLVQVKMDGSGVFGYCLYVCSCQLIAFPHYEVFGELMVYIMYG